MTQKILPSLSADRFEPYLKAVGYDQSRAFKLYMWNLHLSSAFYPLLASIEVALRNRIILCLKEAFGDQWWDSAQFQSLLGKRGKGILLRAVKEVVKSDRALTDGRITAELSFGFWTNMFLPKYEAHLLQCFCAETPLAEAISREQILDRCNKIRVLRNRISHHETLIGRNITLDYSETLELLRWICPDTADWIKPELKIMALVRQRP